MKFLIDMNLSPSWVDTLAASGLEAAHWSSMGALNALDSEIMGIARMQDWIVLTHDLDFSAILAATQAKKPSVIQIRSERTSPALIGAQIISAIHQVETELERGALVTIEPERSRIRMLPLQLR